MGPLVRWSLGPARTVTVWGQNAKGPQPLPMIIHFGTASLNAEWKASIVCLGVFDGVHLGHRSLIEPAVRQAKEREIPSVAVTFDRNPLALLRPESSPKALCSLDQKFEWLAALGLSACVVLPFDLTLSQMSAQEFLDLVLRERLKAAKLLIGHDFAFGRGREGDAAWLSGRIDAESAPPFALEGARVSSSVIRRLVAAGEVERAGLKLGRPFALRGVVVAGQKLGRTLGFPTLNLAFSSDLALPADGVYAAWAETPLGRFMAGVSIGMRPTVDGRHRTTEAFLIDYPGDSIYSAPVALEFHSRIREEKKFLSLEELVEQMGRDIGECRIRLQE